MEGDYRAYIAQIRDLKQDIHDSLSFIEWKKHVNKGDTVFVKPNFTYPFYKEGITTNPAVLRSLLEFLKDRASRVIVGVTTKVIIKKIRMNQKFTIVSTIDGFNKKSIPQNNGNYLINNPKVSELTSNTIDTDNLPLVSFCIPTKNNEDTLEKCLKSIKEQNYPLIEIIIIDGYSNDTTIEIAKKFTNNIFFSEGTLGNARQKSFEYSKGQIIALFDSDIIIPHSEWLRNAIQFFNYDTCISTVWPVCIAPPNAQKIQYLYQTQLWRIFINDRIQKNRSIFGGGNALFLKKCLDEIGGINSNLHWGEDFDWAMKLKERGYKVVFIHDPLYHDTMRTLKQFYRKQFLGANTFAIKGFGLMGLTTRDIFYEHFILGFKGMIRGLLIHRDISWIYYPFLLFARLYAYLITTFLRFFQQPEVS